jgi:hypothetical protein
LIRNIFSTYIRGWFLWLLALVCVFTELSAQRGGNPILAYEFSTRNLLHTEPILIQQPKATALAAMDTKLSASNAARTFANSNTDLNNIYGFQDFWLTRPILQRPAFSLSKVKFAPIPRHYYSDNIFDIDDTSNPFALPRQQKALLAQQEASNSRPSVRQKISSAWSEIMVLDNPEQSEGSPMWLTFVVFGLLGMLAIKVSLFRKELFDTFHAFGNGTAAGQVFREEQGLLATPSNLLQVFIFSLSMGIFGFLAAQQLGAPATFNTLPALSLTILCAGGLYLAKHAQIAFAAWLLPYRHSLQFYNFIVSNTNKVLGLGLIPLLLFLAYSPAEIKPTVLYISLAALAAVYLYRNFKAISALADVIQLHKFYFFVYLCTVEIAPWLIALKLLSIL